MSIISANAKGALWFGSGNAPTGTSKEIKLPLEREENRHIKWCFSPRPQQKERDTA
jgi:hypothetical protein